MNEREREEKSATNSEEFISLFEKSKYSLDQVNSWINNVDIKVEISCVLMTFVLGVITFVASNILRSFEHHSASSQCLFTLFVIASALTCIGFFVSLYFHIKAIMPKLNSSKVEKKEKVFPLFFSDISDEKAEDYYLKIKNASYADFTDEIVSETYLNAEICTKKMKSFKKGIWFVALTIILALITCILYYVTFAA